MNDRFKYRVWDIRHKEYFTDPNPTPPLNSDGTLGFTYNKSDFQKYYIIEQCTGLKDKNGNLIYEGDIVADGYVKRKVVWGGWYWNAKATCDCPLDNITTRFVEIIGNIHNQKD